MTITGWVSRRSGTSPDVQSNHPARIRRAFLDHVMPKLLGDLVQKTARLRGAMLRALKISDGLRSASRRSQAQQRHL